MLAQNTVPANEQTSLDRRSQEHHGAASQQQPGYSTTSGQQQATTAQQPTMRDHPVESVKQTVQEHNPLSAEQPHHRHHTTPIQGQSGVGNQPPLQEHHESIVKNPVLEGHVFARLQLFATLQEKLRNDATQFQAYVEQDRNRLFEIHRHALIKSVYSVKGKDLIFAITKWLHVHYVPPTRYVPHAQTGASDAPGAVDSEGLQIPVSNTAEPASIRQATPAPAPTQASPSAPTSLGSMASSPSAVVAEQLKSAKLVAEALVLSGFLTPYKETEGQMATIAPDYFVRDDELLVPVARSVTELETISVWDVTDGAVYARTLKRKAGVLGQFTDGKDVYVVMNEKSKKAYLFESDLARAPILEILGDLTYVQFDNSQYDFGVRVEGLSAAGSGEKETSELFNAGTQHAQEEFVNAWLGIGAHYREHDVQKLIDAKARGLDQTKHSGLTTEPHEAAVADVAATSMLGLAAGQAREPAFAHGSPASDTAKRQDGYLSGGQPAPVAL